MATEHTHTVRTTENTTLNNARIAVAVVAALTAVGLIGRGAYGVATQSSSGSAHRTVDLLQDSQPVLASLRVAARTEFRQSADGSLVALAGFIATIEAHLAGVASPKGRAWLEKARADLRTGLSKSPADGFAWLRLAGTEFLREGASSPAQIVPALQMAFYTARQNKKADPLFMTLSAQIWPLVGQDARTHITGLIQTYWGKHRLSLRALTVTSAGRDLLKNTVGSDPAFDLWIERELRRAKKRRELRQNSQNSPSNGSGLRSKPL